MTKKYDYSSAEQAHWRIDEVIKTMGGLTSIVEEHDKELETIRSTHHSVKIAVYTAVAVITASEIGLFEVVKRFLGL